MCARVIRYTLLLLAALITSQLRYCQAEDKTLPTVITTGIKGRSELSEIHKVLLLEARQNARINLRSARQQFYELRFERRLALR